MTTMDYDVFARKWDGHINELIQVSAKKPDRIEKKHQQIVEGACKVFLEKGYHPTTIREISRAAGMSMGQLYHYVSSKDDVLFLIHRHLQMEFFNHMKSLESVDDGDSVNTLIRSLRHSIPFLVENKKLYQFIFRESKYLNKQHLQVVLQMDDRNIVQYWRQLLEAVKVQTGLAIDVDFAANIIEYLSVFIPMRGWNLKDRPVKESQELLIEYILRAIGIQSRQ
jgi:AcrR family transcriptional regulator